MIIKKKRKGFGLNRYEERRKKKVNSYKIETEILKRNHKKLVNM